MYGMEKDPESIQIAKKSAVFTDLHEVDLNQFNEEKFKEYYGFFDCIALIDVLEHLMYPDQVLQKMKNFLKNNGYFIISLPNISYGEIKIDLLNDDFMYTDTGILDRTHLKFYTYKTIIDVFTKLHLEICESKFKIEDAISRSYKVPTCITKYIRKDPHSYVYQYVMKVTPSGLGENALRGLNHQNIQVEWAIIDGRLKIIRRLRLVDKLFPVGSKRRICVKNICKRLNLFQ